MNELTDASFTVEVIDMHTVRFCIDTSKNNPTLTSPIVVQKCMNEYMAVLPGLKGWSVYYQGPLLYIVAAGNINIDNLRKF